MSTRQTLHTLRREWLVAICSYALLVAPFGCEFSSEILNPGGTTDGGSSLTTNSAGLFLNDDVDDDLMVAGRNADGDAFFVFGTRSANGGIGEVDAIVVETAGGERSLITFEFGRPVHLENSDGSYVHIRYDEVSAERLTATALVYDAVTQVTETVNADIDLQKAAADVAQTIENLTGIEVTLPEEPDTSTAKLQQRAVGPLLMALAVVPLVLLSQFMVVIMGQVMEAIFVAVSAAVEAAVIAAFTPLFMFASLMTEVTTVVEETPLLEIFVELPEFPVIDIVIE